METPIFRQFEAVSGLVPVPRKQERKEGDADPDILVSLTRRLALVEADLGGMRRQLSQFDYDLQDAIDGFYRRRQADRTREVREEIVKTRPPTWKDLLARAVERTPEPGTSVSTSGSDQQEVKSTDIIKRNGSSRIR